MLSLAWTLWDWKGSVTCSPDTHALFNILIKSRQEREREKEKKNQRASCLPVCGTASEERTYFYNRPKLKQLGARPRPTVHCSTTVADPKDFRLDDVIGGCCHNDVRDSVGNMFHSLFFLSFATISFLLYWLFLSWPFSFLVSQLYHSLLILYSHYFIHSFFLDFMPFLTFACFFVSFFLWIFVLLSLIFLLTSWFFF